MQKIILLESHTIGNNYCIHNNAPFVLRCDLDRSNYVPSPVPTPLRTWALNYHTFSSTLVLQPGDQDEESIRNQTRTYAVFTEGILYFPPIQILPSGAIMLDSSLGMLYNKSREEMFRQYNGMYECNVMNVYGSITKTTIISSCG